MAPCRACGASWCPVAPLRSTTAFSSIATRRSGRKFPRDCCSAWSSWRWEAAYYCLGAAGPALLVCYYSSICIAMHVPYQYLHTLELLLTLISGCALFCLVPPPPRLPQELKLLGCNFKDHAAALHLPPSVMHVTLLSSDTTSVDIGPQATGLEEGVLLAWAEGPVRQVAMKAATAAVAATLASASRQGGD